LQTEISHFSFSNDL